MCSQWQPWSNWDARVHALVLTARFCYVQKISIAHCADGYTERRRLM